MPVFFTFLNTRIRGGHTIKQLPENHQTYLQICMPLVVTTTDLMFKKIFELSWFDKLHVEMVWCSCEGSYDIFVGYMIVEIQVILSLSWNFAWSGTELKYLLG